MGGVLEAAIRRPAVAFQHAGVALAEDRRRVGVAAAWGDPVDRDLRADEGPQPRPCPPTRQPVSSGATTGLARTPAANAWSVGWARRAALRPAWTTPPGVTWMPSWPSSAAILPAGTPSPLLSQAASATARGPSWAPAAPSAAEVCARWRGCTRRPQERQRPTRTSKRVTSGRAGGSSSWYWVATRSSVSTPPQPGQHAGNPTVTTWSTCAGARRWARVP
jgi:hypothetical protein